MKFNWHKPNIQITKTITGWRVSAFVKIKRVYKKYKNIYLSISLLRIDLDRAIEKAAYSKAGIALGRRGFVKMVRTKDVYWFAYSMLSWHPESFRRYGGCGTIRFYGRTGLIERDRQRLHPAGNNEFTVYRFGEESYHYSDVKISRRDFKQYMKWLKKLSLAYNGCFVYT
jgi:hypothetical protein